VPCLLPLEAAALAVAVEDIPHRLARVDADLICEGDVLVIWEMVMAVRGITGPWNCNTFGSVGAKLHLVSYSREPDIFMALSSVMRTDLFESMRFAMDVAGAADVCNLGVTILCSCTRSLTISSCVPLRFVTYFEFNGFECGSLLRESAKEPILHGPLLAHP
jgi:hypothetical protein